MDPLRPNFKQLGLGLGLGLGFAMSEAEILDGTFSTNC